MKASGVVKKGDGGNVKYWCVVLCIIDNWKIDFPYCLLGMYSTVKPPNSVHFWIVNKMTENVLYLETSLFYIHIYWYHNVCAMSIFHSQTQR